MFSPDGSQEIDFQAAFATHEQAGFAAANVLKDKIDPKSSWAISGGTGKPRQLTLITKKPQEFKSGNYRITLQQKPQYKQHLLTQFTFSLTTDPTALEQLCITPAIRKLIERDPESLIVEEQKELNAFYRSIAPSLEDELPNRLALAKWLVNSENPLTNRVIANRYWEQIFGIGLVATSKEFESQGDLPSYPQLLDWLAVELQESGWNIKQFLKMLVMSAT